jgi:dienelactone hydrolase
MRNLVQSLLLASEATDSKIVSLGPEGNLGSGETNPEVLSQFLDHLRIMAGNSFRSIRKRQVVERIRLTYLDAFLLATLLLASGAWLSLRTGAAARWIILALAAALAVAQVFLEGCYWQFWSGYGVMAMIVAWRILRSGTRQTSSSHFPVHRLVAALGAALIIGPWLIAPAIPGLPLPSGPYPVGTSIFRWVDKSRLELAAADLSDRRNVVAQVFYPAIRASGGEHPPYIDGIGNLPDSVAGLPSWVMKGYDQIDDHARLDARISDEKARWPVLLFSPGNGAPRAYYTGLATELASRGIIVLVFDHPFESAVTRLADGRVVTDAASAARFRKIAGDPSREDAFMAAEQNLRADDMRFGLSRLLANSAFAAHVQTDIIVAGGHSFGGASAVTAAANDAHIRAAINIDGTIYGDASGSRLEKPFLLIESDHSASPHGKKYLEGAKRLMATASPAARYELRGSNHFSFTDGPLFFSWPGQVLLGMALGGGRDTSEVHRSTARLITEFVKAIQASHPRGMAEVHMK